MNKKCQKTLSLLLTLLMLVSLFPSSFAQDLPEEPEDSPAPVLSSSVEDESTETEPETEEIRAEEIVDDAEESLTVDSPEESAAPEALPSEPEPMAETDGTESEDISGEIGEAVPAAEYSDSLEEKETVEGTDAETDETEAVSEAPADEEEAGTDPEESENCSLPDGFTGMPEGYELSDSQQAEKQELRDHHIAENAFGLQPGKDYVENEVFFLADSREYAEMVADAYNADLKSFSHGVAVLSLRETSVAEAVEAASDPELNLPMVEPNYIVRGGTVTPDLRETDSDIDVMSAEQVPVLESWQSWYEGSGDPDSYLCNPTSDDYPYFHDVVNTYEAWGVTRGAGVTVALLDTGVYAEHEDLKNNVQVLATSLGTSNLHPNATGYAGILGATVDNGNGVAGVAPEVTILSVRVLDEDAYGPISDVIEGLEAVREDGRADIINISFTDYYYTVAYKETIQKVVDAGMTVVADMGWNASNIKCYPAAFDIPGVIAVGLATRGGSRSVVSNYGAWEDVLAPGTYIWSTSSDGSYAEISGSGCPVVSGVCALYMSAHRHQTPKEMEKIIRSAKTGGIVDAAKLFKVDRTAPEIFIDALSYGKVPYGSEIILSAASGASNGACIIYTLNGKNPSVKGGLTVNGTVYGGNLTATEENGFVPGKKVTLKAACVSGVGVLSKVASVSFTVGQNSETIDTSEVSVPPADIVDMPAANSVDPSLASSIAITGQRYIAPGKSATYKAIVSPSTVKNKSVVWSVSDSEISVTAKGKVTVPADFSGSFTVIATASDESGVYAEYPVEVQDPILSIGLMMDDSDFSGAVVKNKNGTLKQATLYSVHTDFLGNASLQLAADVVGPDAEEDLAWVSSKPAVATVDENGLVTAVSAGTATISCKALDGSGKKASTTIKVINPASSVTVVSASNYGFQDSILLLSPGKSVNNKAVLGDAFGKPSIKKVAWSYDVYVDYYGEDPGSRLKIMDNKWVSVNSSGKLTVKKAIAKLAEYHEIYITVYARTTDGSDLKGSVEYLVQPPYTSFALSRAYEVKELISGDTYSEYYRTRTSKPNTSMTVTTYNNRELTFTVDSDWAGYRYQHFKVKSSNPNIVGAEIDFSSNTYPDVHVFTNGDGKKGTAKITITTTDGTNKKCTITVKVI